MLDRGDVEDCLLESATRMMKGYFFGCSNAAHKGKANELKSMCWSHGSRLRAAPVWVAFWRMDEFVVELGRRVGEIAGEINQRKADKCFCTLAAAVIGLKPGI